MTDLLEIKLAFAPISDDPEREQAMIDDKDEDEDEKDEDEDEDVEDENGDENPDDAEDENGGLGEKKGAKHHADSGIEE